MKFNIEPLKGFPLNNDQKETLLGLIKKMCDEGNAAKPVQANEPIQINVYPNKNSSAEWFVATKFGTTLNQHISIGEDLVLFLIIHNDELFEYVEKNVLHCAFELILYPAVTGKWHKINQYDFTFNLNDDATLSEYSAEICFKVDMGEGEILTITISIRKK